MAESPPGFRRIGDESVCQRTGRTWEDWFRLLDDWNAKEKGHTESARYLRDQHGILPWWAQAVTIRYQWARGLQE